MHAPDNFTAAEQLLGNEFVHSRTWYGVITRNNAVSCAICPAREGSNELGRLLGSPQAAAGHAKSNQHRAREQRANFESPMFTVDQSAFCALCHQHIAASEVSAHLLTKHHHTTCGSIQAGSRSHKRGRDGPAKKQRTEAGTVQLAASPLVPLPMMSLEAVPTPADHQLLLRIKHLRALTGSVDQAWRAACDGDYGLAQLILDGYTSAVATLLSVSGPTPPATHSECRAVEEPRFDMSIDGLFPQFGDNLSLHPPGDSIQGQSTPEGMRQLLEELSLAPEPQKSYKGKEKAETMAAAEAEADASQRPSTLGGSHETEREVDIAAMVTLGCQVVLMAGERSHASKQLQQTNSLLAALEVPRHLHFSADLSGSHARIVRLYMWVQRYRGEFSAAIYNLCLSLTFVGHATEECEAMAVHRRALESFLDQAESRFRPDFVKKWRTALPKIYGDQKRAETVKLVELLGQETQWYDQQTDRLGSH